MNNTFYFLRHGETTKDKSIPISRWKLSDKGIEQASELADEQTFQNIDVVFASTEEKAFQSAKPIADSIGKEILQVSELSELKRDKGGFMKAEDYEKTLRFCLENLTQSLHNWETADHALKRFLKKIEEIDSQYESKNILIVGHSFTINLYFAQLLNKFDNVYQRFNQNNYTDWGIVRNKKVVKDIAS